MDSGTTLRYSTMAVLLLAAILLATAWLKLKPWWDRARMRESILNGINSEYEQLRLARKDLVYHYYWALSRNDDREADMHESQVLDMDRKLEQLRERYWAVERGIACARMPISLYFCQGQESPVPLAPSQLTVRVYGKGEATDKSSSDDDSARMRHPIQAS
ncbi:hypothetical protein FOL47_008948 [Perkinsus chesapeaki]|uniref:Uncharacterized protein n=1 Tax=Perkinsus chesapeaki TaxID=330153 RepID=A0A7J6N1Y6_PERCH|nr:hypothetical protein FOL47_008948 [Perkinsus chesapeaki]